MKKYVSIFTMLFMVFTLVLSACSEGNNNTSPAEGTTPANSANSNENHSSENNGGSESTGYEIPEGTTITIVNGGGNSLEKQMAQYGDLLEKKFPQVNFEFKGTTSELKIDKMILGGEKFDIFIRSIGSYFMEAPENGFQYDMTELIEQHDVDLSGIDPVLLNSMTSNAGGEMWGIPFLNSTLVLYYNKDLFDTFGVDYPTDGMTWDEVLDLAKSFNQTKDGVPYVGLAVSDHHLTKLNNFGLSYVDPNTNLSTYDDERWRHIVEIFQKNGEDPGFQDFMAQNENKIADNNTFYGGQAAMLAALVHHSGHEQFERPEFNWDMASIPTYEENPGIGGQAYPEYAGIASFSENKDAALEIIKYMVSKEFQLEFSKKGFMPVLTDEEVQAAYGTEAFQGKNQTAVFHLSFAPVMIKSPYDNDVERALTGKKNDLALGKIDINTMLRTAKEEADLKISQNSGN